MKKQCRICLEIKDISEYYIIQKWYKNTCKKCDNIRHEKWRQTNKDKIQKYNIKKRKDINKTHMLWYYKNHDKVLLNKRTNDKTKRQNLATNNYLKFLIKRHYDIPINKITVEMISTYKKWLIVYRLKMLMNKVERLQIIKTEAQKEFRRLYDIYQNQP